MNLRQLAKITGFSISTVSKAFSGSREISNETKNKIFKTAREYGCFEKYYHDSYDKHVIAVLCRELRSEYYAQMVETTEQLISARGDITIIAENHFNNNTTLEYFRYFTSYAHVDGVIIIGQADNLKNPNLVPTVVIGSRFKSDPVNFDIVRLDISKSIFEAVTYLQQKGHCKIAFVGEHNTDSRLQYFKEAINASGIKLNPRYIINSDKRFQDAGYEATEKLLSLEEPPTAIITAYDYIALGVHECLKDHNMTVPENMSLIGIDDISLSSSGLVLLTTIRAFSDEACKAAVDLIYKKIDNQFYTARQRITICSELIKRASVSIPCR